MDLLFTDSNYTSISDVTNNTSTDEAWTVNVYPLNKLWDYWEQMLDKHWITDVQTSLWINPRFDITFIDPIERKNTIFESNRNMISNDQVQNFFRDAVIENRINLSSYDVVMYVQYQPVRQWYWFERAFASTSSRRWYMPFKLYSDNFVFNKSFLTMAHELWHQIFHAEDLYSYSDNVSLQFPRWIPDPSWEFPQTQACLMGWSYWLRMNERDSSLVTSYSYRQARDKFYFSSPNNFVLCADTIKKIMNDVENPNCPLEDFYVWRCWQCTSLNYLSCSR